MKIGLFKKKLKHAFPFFKWKSVRLVGFFSFGAFLAGALLLLSVWFWYEQLMRDEVYPNVRIADIELKHTSRQDAEALLNQAVALYLTHNSPHTLRFNDYAMEINDWSKVVTVDVPSSVNQAYALGREAHFISAWKSRWHLLTQSAVLPLIVTVDEAWWKSTSASLSATLDVAYVPEEFQVDQSNPMKPIVTLTESVAGRTFLTEKFHQSLISSFSGLKPLPQHIPVEIHAGALSESQKEAAIIRATAYLSKSLAIHSEQASVQPESVLGGEQLLPFLKIGGGYEPTVIREYITQAAEAINRTPVEARFEFNEDSKKVTVFSAPKDGIRVEIDSSAERMKQALSDLETASASGSLVLKATTFPPNITLDEVNTLGINELIGQGESTYLGSIATRVHNVALTASRLNGTLVKPQEVFSFNAAIGDVSAVTGYQPAYIIRNGRTELGDGGGVCQDSTTLFRAVLDAGLPVVHRRSHSYRVGYYEQDAKAGLDATVYSPSTDFTFLNDTPAHILVQARADSPNRQLTIELYGTNDGRRSEVVNHRVYDVVPAPPDVFVDDPTLKLGEVKQIDWKAAGAKAKFDYKVWRGEELLINTSFSSVYKPWASVYLRGTAPQ